MLFKLEDGLLSAKDIAFAKDQELAWSQFIDNFRASDVFIRQKITREEPPENGNITSAFAARIAATVEALCNEVGMSPPDWVYLKRFVLEQPDWGIKNINDPYLLERAQALLKDETLPEFASRNLFYGANVLSRV